MIPEVVPSFDATRRLIVGLIDIGSIKFGAFRLKLHETNPDAPLSPIYIDLRLELSAPSLLRDIAAVLGRKVLSLAPDFVADVPTAATPIVGVIAATFDIPMLTPRSQSKAHGLPGHVEGIPRRGARAVVVDDLITRADSKLEAISILRQQGLVVEDVVVFVDREQGGSSLLAQHGCQLHAIVTLRYVLDILVAEARLPAAKRDEVLAYLDHTVTS